MDNNYFKLINHFVGNVIKWIYFLGKKSIDEVAEEDNSTLGFIVILILLLVTLGFENNN
ncbi:hypothetical protein [Flavobacterium sp.]|jgi:hypothetical protein|uniref:hypothetical protein n=1 Tax=Flavobacterium sp. TaxID=239 RepID=UPI00391A8352